MLCEICHEKEATVRITRIHHGNSESHNLCQDCAKQYGAEDPEAQDLSKAIFKLLAGALMKHLGPQNQNSEENGRAKKLACPNCGNPVRSRTQAGGPEEDPEELFSHLDSFLCESCRLPSPKN